MSNRGWTEAETDRVRAVYPAGSAADVRALARGLGRSVSAVCQYARKLGLARPDDGRAWAAAEDALVRGHYGRDLTAAALAARLGRGVAAVHKRARVLGCVGRGVWGPEARALVQERYAADGAAALAVRIYGHAGPLAVRGIYNLAARLGLTAPIRHPQWVKDRVRELHAAGLTDAAIARRMRGEYAGFNGRNDRERATAIRRRLGLPKNRFDAAAAVRKQMATLGLNSPTELRTAAHRKVAAGYGLPPDLRLRQVQILLCLSAGPLTEPEIRARLGVKALLLNRRRGDGRGGPAGTYLSDLARRGLVVWVPVPRGFGAAGPRRRYLLTPLAMGLLAGEGGRGAGEADGGGRPPDPAVVGGPGDGLGDGPPARGDARDGPGGPGAAGAAVVALPGPAADARPGAVPGGRGGEPEAAA